MRVDKGSWSAIFQLVFHTFFGGGQLPYEFCYVFLVFGGRHIIAKFIHRVERTVQERKKTIYDKTKDPESPALASRRPKEIENNELRKKNE